MQNAETKSEVDAPRYGLQHLIKLGRQMNSDETKKGWYVAELSGNVSASDSSGHLRDRLRSGELFGLFERKHVLNEDTGVTKTQYFLTLLGKRFASSGQESRTAGRAAMWNVSIFVKLYSKYVRSQLPGPDVLHDDLQALGLRYKEGGLNSVRRAFEQSLSYTMLMTPERQVQEVEIPLKAVATLEKPTLVVGDSDSSTLSSMVFGALAKGVTDSTKWTTEHRVQWLKHVLLCWNLGFTESKGALTIQIEKPDESLLQ